MRSPSSRCSPTSQALARNPETPLVGRERERNRLWRDFEDVLDERSCRLVTLLGPAGIGKSRLVADFLERVGDSADVLRGRCLSYGEGITYWPLVEILIAIGVEPDSVIGTSPAETQLAFRRLLEARAAERPAGRRRRRPAVGRARLHRPRRARRRLLARRADLPALRRAHRAPRRTTRLGWRQDERDVDPARASRRRRMRGADRNSRRRRVNSKATSATASSPPPPETRCTSRRCSRWCASTAATARSSSRRRSMLSSRPASTRSTATSVL